MAQERLERIEKPSDTDHAHALELHAPLTGSQTGRSGIVTLAQYVEGDAGDTNQGSELIDEANAAMSAGDVIRAKMLFERAYAALEFRGDLAYRMDALAGLASVMTSPDYMYATWQDREADASYTDDAIEYLETALGISRGVEEVRVRRMELLDWIIQLHFAQKDYSALRDRLLEKLSIEEELSGGAGSWRTHESLASAYLALGELDAVQRHLSEASSSPEGVSDETTLQALVNRVAFAYAVGDITGADELVQRALDGSAGAPPVERARMLERFSVVARHIGQQAAACWIDEQTADLYRVAGLMNDVLEVRMLMSDFDC
ncbi:MAG: hypothetical protein PVI23_13855 [Maricaulaceae bacterium]|jgi:tetratricopeptide (TPR) repeat protein